MREMMMIAALVAALSFQSFSSSADFMYNVRSAADALVVGRAASEEGAVVHAYWSGSVVLHRPIKVNLWREELFKIASYPLLSGQADYLIILRQEFGGAHLAGSLLHTYC